MHGLITEDQLLNALATKFQMRFVDLTAQTPGEEALAALSEGLVNRLQVFPLELVGSRLVVATSAPTDPAIGDDLRFCTKYTIDLVVASSTQIAQAIERYYQHKEEELDTIFDEMKGEHEVTVEEDVESSSSSNRTPRSSRSSTRSLSTPTGGERRTSTSNRAASITRFWSATGSTASVLWHIR